MRVITLQKGEVEGMTLAEKIALACDADKAYTKEGQNLRETLSLEDAMEILEEIN